jgi:predicted aconitase
MQNLDKMKLQLNPEEEAILRGEQGPTLAKVMRTIALYGEALGAERLIAPPIELLDELAEAGLMTKFPFTLDPRPPLDFKNLSLQPEHELVVERMFHEQAEYDRRMHQLGLRDALAYSCNPFQAEFGNIPERGAILAWSESASVIYANSVHGARSNRNGAIIELLSNILGKTPLTGLLTDEGRRANWLVELRAAKLPSPQLLGAAIGSRVLEGIPFMVGLDRFLGPGLSGDTCDYLHEMGAAAATYGAVGLFHVENITLEAVDSGRDLLVPGHASWTLTEQTLRDTLASFPMMWNESDAKPQRCFIGCPHLSMRQLQWWSDEIHSALQAKGQEHLAVETFLCAASQVLEEFKASGRGFDRLIAAGAKFTPACLEILYEADVMTGEAVITNSSKLRAYSTARFIPDEALVDILVAGEMGGEKLQ